MRKSIYLLLIGLLFVTHVSAETVCPQRLSPTEFNQRQREFITTEANLTENEANAFFQLYFELQEKKRQNNQEVWKIMRRAKEDLTEKEYESALSQIYKLRKKNTELDLEYFYKFQDIIPNKKIYAVLKAESRFQRHIIRGMHQNQKGRRSRRMR